MTQLESPVKPLERLRPALIAVLVLSLACACFLILYSVKEQGHVEPAYPQVDISHLLNREELRVEDYETLYYQTGLGRQAVDDLQKDPSSFGPKILGFQDKFFKSVQYDNIKNTLISAEEFLINDKGGYIRGTDLAPIQNGDIIITKSSHVYAWRNGHAALVVDADQGLTLESVVLGENSKIQLAKDWTQYPNFLILRLKEASQDFLDQLASSALANLKDVPYRLTVGLLSPKFQEIGKVTRTHCSHLVWQAYQYFGYDLDANGGAIVTPKNLANSPHLEVIQVYGMDPDQPW